MNAYIVAMDAVAVVLLSAVAAWLIIAARRGSPGPFRAVSLGGAAVCLLLVVASLHHLLTVAAHVGLLVPQWIDWLLGPLAALQATLAVVVAVAAMVLARRSWHRLGRAQTMVEALTERLPSEAQARQAKLTSREQQVLDLIRSGVITDREIAAALHVAPATAATHVQRVLHKTRLHSRRDLMLLPPRKDPA